LLDEKPSLVIKYNRPQKEIEEKLSKYIVVRFILSIKSIFDEILF
jgi:hypothetical protein